MKHPCELKVFRVGDSKPLSILELQKLVKRKIVQPTDVVRDSEGEVYLAKQIAELREPKWARSLQHDKVLGLSDGLITEILENLPPDLLDDLEDDFFEDIPAEYAVKRNNRTKKRKSGYVRQR